LKRLPFNWSRKRKNTLTKTIVLTNKGTPQKRGSESLGGKESIVQREGIGSGHITTWTKKRMIIKGRKIRERHVEREEEKRGGMKSSFLLRRTGKCDQKGEGADHEKATGNKIALISKREGALSVK